MSAEGNIRMLYLQTFGRVPGNNSVIANQANVWRNRIKKFVNEGNSQEQAQKKTRDIFLSDYRNSAEYANRPQIIKNAYRTFLGREPSQAELSQQNSSGSATDKVVQSIAGSAEAKAFTRNFAAYTNAYSDVRGYGSNSDFEYQTNGLWSSQVTSTIPSQSNIFRGLEHWNTGGKKEDRIIPNARQIIGGNQNNIFINDAAKKFLGSAAQSKINTFVTRIKKSKGGDYKNIMNQTVGAFNPVVREQFFRFNSTNGKGGSYAITQAYYANKIGQWSFADNNVQPPTGAFSTKYFVDNYGSQYGIKTAMDNAIANRIGGYKVPDLDIAFYYGGLDLNTDSRINPRNSYAYLDNWANYRYGQIVKQDKSVRGNAAKDTKAVDEYNETFDDLTDTEKSRIRDTMLGIGEDYESQPNLELLQDSELLASFLTEGPGEKAQEDQQKFYKTVQASLKKTTAKMKEAKAIEYELDLYRGLPGFSEVFGVNSSIANSLLGDSGIGGYLGIMGINSSQLIDNFEKQLGDATGIKTEDQNVNWQNWFEEEFTTDLKGTKYVYADKPEDMSDEEWEQVKDTDEYRDEIDQEFINKFIDDYITPRFNTSRSMEEFASYLDVKQEEENVLQTQTTLNALTQTVITNAEEFYSGLAELGGVKFNSTFYIDPTNNQYKTVNPIKEDFYIAQAARVKEDWEQAKQNPDSKPNGSFTFDGKTFSFEPQYTWAQLAYMYGLDINKESDFAALHYQSVGSQFKFDAAEDVVTEQDVEEQITKFVTQATEDYDDEGQAPFLDFITPEQFADAVLEGVDPLENREEWEKILEAYGLGDEVNVNELREYIEETLRTGAAKDIREGIKYLNQKKLKPTQERLGITYIERDEDFAEEDDPDATALYQTFKDAGYGGTEDQFYEEFMSDVSREEQKFLTDFMTGKTNLSFSSVNLSDPFEALAGLDQLFGSGSELGIQEKEKRDRDKAKERGNYFDLFPEVDSDYDEEIDKGIGMDFATFFG